MTKRAGSVQPRVKDIKSWDLSVKNVPVYASDSTRFLFLEGPSGDRPNLNENIEGMNVDAETRTEKMPDVKHFL